MRRYGYHPSFAAGTVAVGATLDILIPPSTAMVIYAVITEVDLGRLMIAGFMPGAYQAVYKPARRSSIRSHLRSAPS